MMEEFSLGQLPGLLSRLASQNQLFLCKLFNYVGTDFSCISQELNTAYCFTLFMCLISLSDLYQHNPGLVYYGKEFLVLLFIESLKKNHISFWWLCSLCCCSQLISQVQLVFSKSYFLGFLVVFFIKHLKKHFFLIKYESNNACVCKQVPLIQLTTCSFTEIILVQFLMYYFSMFIIFKKYKYFCFIQTALNFCTLEYQMQNTKVCRFPLSYKTSVSTLREFRKYLMKEWQ